MVKKRTLNELRQEKTYGYKAKEDPRPTVQELINKYPNDTELGKQIRKLWKK
tara:strand:+ start:2339 stop:2494 length:156 start_codon:yes stop_codon:yes gene_type:complete